MTASPASTHEATLTLLLRQGEASAAELADQLVALLSGFPRAAELASLRRGVGEMARWEENWTAVAAPVFDALRRQRS